jgi:phosphoribosylformylglycinamidine cyclo-ligase
MTALTYKKAGVDTRLADQLVDHIARNNPAIGGFAGLFPLTEGGPAADYSLVACTDGVGTKLKVAFLLDRHDTIGVDLVAMCVNDLICCGARPLLFLDYYAAGKLQLKRSKAVIAGIMEGCRQGRSLLLGGETAEMPGFYTAGEYDLAGFSVGIVKKSETIDGSKISAGDVIMALPSSGFHSNGYSLIRSILKGPLFKKWAKTLLTPTRIYVDDVMKLIAGLRINGGEVLGMAHITGGGLVENVPRFLPAGKRAVIRRDAWQVPAPFRDIQKLGKIPEKAMWTTFNMGLGLVFVVRRSSADAAKRLLPDAMIVGEITEGPSEVELT